MIRAENVYFRYGNGKTVLRDINAEFRNGRIYGLLGMNGSGKTTLLKLLAGLLFPRQGRVTMDGNDIPARGIGTLMEIFLMQSGFRFGRTSLKQFLRLHSGFYPHFSMDILEDCLRETGLGMDIPDLDRISLGEKQKVMSAIAIASGSGFLLMDEPSEGMDIPSRKIFRKLLLRHLKEKQTAVISTHHVEELSDILSDIVILGSNGDIAFAGSVEDISERFAFGTSRSAEGALYSEPCPEGYRIIRRNDSGESGEMNLEMLFNAAIKGKLQ